MPIDPLLEQPTPEELRRRELARRRAEEARAQAEAAPTGADFTLTGSDRPADLAIAHGQRGLFEDET